MGQSDWGQAGKPGLRRQSTPGWEKICLSGRLLKYSLQERPAFEAGGELPEGHVLVLWNYGPFARRASGQGRGSCLGFQVVSVLWGPSEFATEAT